MPSISVLFAILGVASAFRPRLYYGAAPPPAQIQPMPLVQAPQCEPSIVVEKEILTVTCTETATVNMVETRVMTESFYTWSIMTATQQVIETQMLTMTEQVQVQVPVAMTTTTTTTETLQVPITQVLTETLQVTVTEGAAPASEEKQECPAPVTMMVTETQQVTMTETQQLTMTMTVSEQASTQCAAPQLNQPQIIVVVAKSELNVGSPAAARCDAGRPCARGAPRAGRARKYYYWDSKSLRPLAQQQAQSVENMLGTADTEHDFAVQEPQMSPFITDFPILTATAGNPTLQ